LKLGVRRFTLHLRIDGFSFTTGKDEEHESSKNRGRIVPTPNKLWMLMKFQMLISESMTWIVSGAEDLDEFVQTFEAAKNNLKHSLWDSLRQ